nr:pathogenesis-related protein PRB1-3-like [Ipomoea batatas]
MRSLVQGIILGKSSILLILLLLSQTSSLCLSKPIRQTPCTRNTIRQFLLPHNTIRAKLGIPPLKWSPKLASYASWWAHRRRQNCELLHSDGDYGENLFWGSGTDWAPGDAVAAWAKERLYYD